MALEKPRKDEYFDKLETMTTPARLKYQEENLCRTVKNACENAPAAREQMDKAGIKPQDIREFADLEKIPVIRKNDVIEHQKKNPPFGGFSAIPPENVERIFISPGPIYEPGQHSSIKWFGKSFWAAGFRKGDIALNSFTYHMSPAGILFHEGLRDCGAAVIPMGTGNTELQVRTMLALKVTGFVGTPSFLMAVIKQAQEMGYVFPGDFNLKRAWFTGEMLTPSMRQVFEEQYRIDTCQAYAVTEPGGAIAYECWCKEGMHFMDEYLIEVVDPQTGRQLPPGEVGEIVVTPIHNPTWGLLRFGTGDLSAYTTGPCRCGRTANRLTGIVGRASDAVKVRGMFVVAKQAEAVFSGFSQIARYQVVVRRPAERDEVCFRLELKDKDADKNALSEELNKKFQNLCLVKADKIEFVPGGTIPEGSKTIVDERSWK
jgi:phenylacetate-CoA ligase